MIKRAFVAAALVLGLSGCSPASAKNDLAAVGVRALKPDCERRNKDAMSCLACAVYFESRGEPDIGQEMVAHVVLNRAKHRKFPTKICEVVWQKGQFAWTNDRHSNRPRDMRSWKKAVAVSERALKTNAEAPKYLFFRRGKRGGTRIGQHVFR